MIFGKEWFLKNTAKWMLRHGQERRRLDLLILDITGGEDWWPEGLPDMRVNHEFREQYIKENWGGELIRLGRNCYRVVIENVLGLYYVLRLERRPK